MFLVRSVYQKHCQNLNKKELGPHPRSSDSLDIGPGYVHYEKVLQLMPIIPLKVTYIVYIQVLIPDYLMVYFLSCILDLT